MAVAPEPSQQSRTCPQCDDDLVHEGGFWQCEGCSHVPRHAAD